MWKGRGRVAGMSMVWHVCRDTEYACHAMRFPLFLPRPSFIPSFSYYMYVCMYYVRMVRSEEVR